MKIKFGSFVVAGSGKIGGHVAAKNRGGAYLRTKVTPLNPNTNAQASSRALLASLSTAWSGLTDAQRASWNGAVASFATTDIFGDLRNPSGLNLYVKLNANLSNAGLPLLSVAPEKVEVPFSQLTSATFSIAAGELTILFADAGFAAQTLKIQATPAMSAGVSFVKSQLRTIFTSDTWDEADIVGTSYVSKYGVPALGQNIVVSVAPITNTGQQGVPQTIKATIVA